MTSRRSLVFGSLAVAAGGLGLAATDRLDDALQLVGIRPASVPDQADATLLAAVHADQRRLLARAGAAPKVVREALAEQFATVGGKPGSVTQQHIGDLAPELAAAANVRARQAAAAHSGELAQVLASMAAGLDLLAAAL